MTLGFRAVFQDCEAFEVAAWLQSLILDGIIGGVALFLDCAPNDDSFLLLSVLEDCGYMARVAFIMDRIFKIFGLSENHIPLLISTGCGVPGIMASRTIESENERKDSYGCNLCSVQCKTSHYMHL